MTFTEVKTLLNSTINNLYELDHITSYQCEEIEQAKKALLKLRLEKSNFAKSQDVKENKSR